MWVFGGASRWRGVKRCRDDNMCEAYAIPTYRVRTTVLYDTAIQCISYCGLYNDRSYTIMKLHKYVCM